MKNYRMAALLGGSLIIFALSLAGCKGEDANAGGVAGGSTGTASGSKDAALRKGMQSYPKTIDEVPPQYRQMVLDAQKMKDQKKAPMAPQPAPKK